MIIPIILPTYCDHPTEGICKECMEQKERWRSLRPCDYDPVNIPGDRPIPGSAEDAGESR